MKISERKERLRERGVVPVPQENATRGKTVVAAKNGRARATQSSKSTPAQKPQRQKWQPSPRFQIVTGAAYMIFAPILLYENLILAKPHAANNPGAFGIILPFVFFLFGAWWVYRGMQARRRPPAGSDSTSAASAKADLAKGPSQ